MGIVVYLRKEATLKLHFLIEKSFVVPMRHTRIKKLFFQAAVNGVRLRMQIIREHDVKNDKRDYWTDSSLILQWLQSAHKIKQEFIASEVAETLKSSFMDQ